MNSLDYFPDNEPFSFKGFGGCDWNGSDFITFASGLNYLETALENPGVKAVIVPANLACRVMQSEKIAILSDNPRRTFFDAMSCAVDKSEYGLTFENRIPDSLVCDTGTLIEDMVALGDGVTIGKNCLIKSGTIIGDNVTIHDNVIIGSDGMQTYEHSSGHMKNVPHAGGVHIKDRVTLLQGVNISKALYREFTEIGEESVISIGSSIGHGCKLGERVQVSGGVLIGGSTTIGRSVWVGPRATLADGLTIGDFAKIRLGAVVIEDVPHHGDVSGNFAVPHKINVREFSVKKRNSKKNKT